MINVRSITVNFCNLRCINLCSRQSVRSSYDVSPIATTEDSIG